ncbi:MAG: zinc ribbon domain-containing protein, partial [Clostridiales bacterium]|nr:zinc ribbon domain-containing protein [Clostridiales bacterium]
MNKTCNSCGAALAEGQRFCKLCGAAAVREAVPLPAPSVTDGNRESVPIPAPPVTDGSAKKPGKARAMIHMIKSAFVAAVMLTVFGLSFLPVLSGESDALGYQVGTIEYTTLDLIEAMLGGPRDLDQETEALEAYIELRQPLSTDGWTAFEREAYAREIIKDYNLLKLIYTEDVLDAAPFTLRFELTFYLVQGLLLMLGSLAAAIAALITAGYSTVRFATGDYQYHTRKKDLAKWLLPAFFALGFLAIPFIADGALAAAYLSCMILTGAAMAVIFTFEGIWNLIEAYRGKRPEQVVREDKAQSLKRIKNRVAAAVSATLILMLALVFPSTAMVKNVKTDAESESVQKERIDAYENFGLIDLFIQYKGDDDAYKPGSQALGDYLKQYPTAEALPVQALFFFSDSGPVFAGGMAALGVFTCILYLAMTGFLAAAMLFILKGVLSRQTKSTRLFHILIASASLVLLVLPAAFVLSLNGVLATFGVNETFYMSLGAAPVVSLILSLLALGQNL